jgi:hypothetical protein
MKSFSQFLQESYLNEAIPGNMSRDEFNRLPAQSKRRLTGSDVGLGQQEQPLQRPKSPSYGGSSRPAVRSARTRFENSPGSWERRNPGKLPIPNPPEPSPPDMKLLEPGKTGGPLAKPVNQIPDAMVQGAYDAARKNPNVGRSSNPYTSTPTSSGKPPSGSPTRSTPYRNLGLGKENVTSNIPGQQSQSPSSTSSGGRPPSGTTPAAPSPTSSSTTTQRSTLRGRVFRGGLGALSAADAVDSARRGDVGGAIQSSLLAAGSSNRLNQGAARLGQRAVQGAATRLGMKTAGQLAARLVPGLQTAYGLTRGTSALNKGDYLGAALGYASAVPVIGGAAAAADIARDVIDDPTQRYKRIATQGVRSSRQIGAQSGKFGSRYGSAISGSGGPTTVNRQAGTITSGGRTAKLGSTQLISDPKTGKKVVGDLAYRRGKAVYLARPSVASRDTDLFSRFSRWSGIGGQRSADAANAKREYRTALANTQRYQKQIKGIK